VLDQVVLVLGVSVLGQVVLVLGVSVVGLVVLVLGAPVSDQGWVLGRDLSGSLLFLFEETCNQTSRSNVFRFANSMSMRCIRLDSCTLCNTPHEYLLDQCRRRRGHHPNNSTRECCRRYPSDWASSNPKSCPASTFCTTRVRKGKCCHPDSMRHLHMKQCFQDS